jgi:hypothetical protein
LGSVSEAFACLRSKGENPENPGFSWALVAAARRERAGYAVPGTRRAGLLLPLSLFLVALSAHRYARQISFSICTFLRFSYTFLLFSYTFLRFSYTFLILFFAFLFFESRRKGKEKEKKRKRKEKEKTRKAGEKTTKRKAPPLLENGKWRA